MDAAAQTSWATESDALQHVEHVLDQVPLLAFLAPAQRRELAAMADIQVIEPTQRIVAEGTQPHTLFVIADGEVEVARQAGAPGGRHSIRVLGRGETFGELGLVEDVPTSASVYALARTTLLVIPLTDLHRAMAQHARFAPLFRGLATQLSSRLRTLTDVTVGALEREVAQLEARVAVGILLIGMVGVLSVLAYALSLGTQLSPPSWHQPIALLDCGLGLAVTAVLIHRSRLPWSFWGFTTRGWRAAVRDALLCSAPLVVLLVLAKWMLLHPAAGAARPLLDWGTGLAAGVAPLPVRLAPVAVYVLIGVPLQEIIIRGCAQGALQEFLAGPYRALWAIAVSNLIFAVVHSVVSPQMALLTVVPGALWGWLYYRHRTLIAPILSHAIVGALAIDLIGIADFVR